MKIIVSAMAVVHGSLFMPAYCVGISLYLTYFWPRKQPTLKC